MTWELFVRLFHVDVPEELIAGLLFVAVIGVVTVVRFVESNRRNWIVGGLAAAYILVMLWITVISRLDRVSEEFRYCLQPLWCIDAIKSGLIEVLYEKVFNVIFFVPLGIISALATCKWWKVLLFGFITSVAIELLQLVTRTGMCETDDILCNTAGFVIGYGFVKLCSFFTYKIYNYAKTRNT